MKNLFKIAITLAVFLLLFATVPIAVGASGYAYPQEPTTHTVTFYDRGDLICECEVAEGEMLSVPVSPTRDGYKLVGWSVGASDGALFDLGTPISGDIELHAVYELLPPSFDISSLEFTYDGIPHTLAFSSVSHPLLEGSILSYEWYRDGVSIGAYGSSLTVKNVSDSGVYTCRLVLSVGGDVAEVTTPAVEVKISKRAITPPTLDSVYYTGDSQLPPVYGNLYYTVDRTPCTLAGAYPVTLTLTDPDNYCFAGTDKPTATVDFVILPAENFWVTAPAVSDVYESFAPAPIGIPRFGTPVFLYSRNGAEYTADIPIAPGEYLMRAEVAPTENYSGLISEPIPLRIIEERIVGIAVVTPADKMVYRAFDTFDPTGLSVGVTYNSGRHELVGTDKLTVSYQQADSFRYRDSGVIISLGGSSVLLRTTVSRADYDISGISLADREAVYCGTAITPTYEGTLPIGLDGISLSATVTGGGTNVGTYTVTLTFSTESDNYNCPPPLTATLAVLPLDTAVVWTDLSFVYDGTLKLPSAYYLDVHGRKVPLEPTGAYSYAGQYTASVSTPDPNYNLLNPDTVYNILKADYDLSEVFWQGGGEVYDGAEKSVTLGGLPTGVSVIGYVNSTATEAGEYTATAALSYDSVNFNPPTAPSFTWRILKAEYPTDGFSFSDLVATFDGTPHYPALTGKMPVGLDGIALEYAFSGSATHVADGRVAVEIIFTTASANYTAPAPILRYVEITPLDITVTWHNTKFCYTGATLLPSATANECEISVLGGGIDAGDYVAAAISLDPDYRVANDTCKYVIHKAENAWITSPDISNIFFGRAPAPVATALAGESSFTYYADPSCTQPLDHIPSSVGTYYVIAHSTGDKNHNAIYSQPIPFEIIAIIPVALDITLDEREYLALDPITFSAALINNDGSTTPLDASSVGVRYQSADALRYGDTQVAFSYGDLCTTVAVTVLRRDYDLSGVVWSDAEFIYDGAEHSVALTGLPSGVTVREYIGNSFICAGQYTVSVSLDYDTANYNPPSIPYHTVTVKKQTVPLPAVGAAEYDGTTHTATVAHSPLYTVSLLPSAAASGVYPITLTLTDPDNYTFGTSATVTVYFVIAPRQLTVTVSDFDLYLFESEIYPTFEITDGTLAVGDSLAPSYRVNDGFIYADFSTENYDITVIPGTLNHHSTLSRHATSILLLVILLILVLLLILIAVLINRRRIACAILSHTHRYDDGSGDPPAPAPTPDEPTPDEPTPDEPEDAPDLTENTAEVASIVDAEYADAAITNSLARDLIRHDEDVVTSGRRRGIVNVDTLSRSFSAGDRVDINALKSRSLIPYDTAYIKVLARGMIDKPLYVYANDFSLSAVKMIALTGGRAVKVNTVIK